MPSCLETALDLARRGLCVIPVPRPRPGATPNTVGDGKVPAIEWTPYQDQLATEDEIRKWFTTEQNIAVVTGAISGVVVVDADSLAAVQWIRRRLTYTPWQTRTSRGFHLWYQHPGARVGNRACIDTGHGRLEIDLRGDGGFVIAPGSLHASGARYEFAGDWSVDRADLPHFWPGWLARPARPHTSAVPRSRPTGDLVNRARKYLAAIPRPEIGHGSDTAVLSAACKLVRGFGINEHRGHHAPVGVGRQP